MQGYGSSLCHGKISKDFVTLNISIHSHFYILYIMAKLEYLSWLMGYIMHLISSLSSSELLKLWTQIPHQRLGN
jgi:hypothetical protein